MKTLEELINLDEPCWPHVEKWLSEASRQWTILPPSAEHREEALVATQVTTRSPMGAIVYESAGLMIDHGWLRILGSGNHPHMRRSLPEWNRGRASGFYLIADDVLGGFFALNGGALGQDMGNVYYKAPDTLQWEACGMGYTQFLIWSLGPSLDQFYETMRWDGWKDEVSTISGDSGIFVFPFLSTQGPSMKGRIRSAVPISELFILQG